MCYNNKKECTNLYFCNILSKEVAFMPETILMMYVTLASAILAGILNMIWCKTRYLRPLCVPMDGGKNFVDGKRWFGDNKTWKGFIGYIVFNTICAVLWGALCHAVGWDKLNFFYLQHEPSLLYDLLIGFLLGLGYSLFELPNSFIKRRLGIEPGKTLRGAKKVFFVFLDQADSVFGCALVVWLFYDLGIGLYLLFVAVGAATHILMNMLLYFVRLRKNMF